jgi:hypothetical protein
LERCAKSAALLAHAIACRVEEAFAWIRTAAAEARAKLPDCDRAGRVFAFAADLSDRECFDLSGPAMLSISADGGVRGEGEARAGLVDNGAIEIEFRRQNGDDAVFRAKRESSSAA